MIDILHVDESGRTEAQFADPGVLRELLLGQPLIATCCLRFLDPYGDTTFNQLQIPVLADELRALALASPAAIRERAAALVAFIESTQGAIHTYIKFVGD